MRSEIGAIEIQVAHSPSSTYQIFTDAIRAAVVSHKGALTTLIGCAQQEDDPGRAVQALEIVEACAQVRYM